MAREIEELLKTKVKAVEVKFKNKFENLWKSIIGALFILAFYRDNNAPNALNL